MAVTYYGVVSIPYHPGTLRHYERTDAVYPPLEREGYDYTGKRRIVLKAWKFWDVQNGKIVSGINLQLGRVAKESEIK